MYVCTLIFKSKHCSDQKILYQVRYTKSVCVCVWGGGGGGQSTSGPIYEKWGGGGGGGQFASGPIPLLGTQKIL